MSELAILNVSDGDTKLSFDSDNPQEIERAKKIVTDMIRRGYTILVEVGSDDQGPLYRRAKGFDPETCEYIIAGDIPLPESTTESTTDEKAKAPKKRSRKSAATPAKAANRRRSKETRVPAKKTRAVGVGKTAGG